MSSINENKCMNKWRAFYSRPLYILIQNGENTKVWVSSNGEVVARPSNNNNVRTYARFIRMCVFIMNGCTNDADGDTPYLIHIPASEWCMATINYLITCHRCMYTFASFDKRGNSCVILPQSVSFIFLQSVSWNDRESLDINLKWFDLNIDNISISRANNPLNRLTFI